MISKKFTSEAKDHIFWETSLCFKERDDVFLLCPTQQSADFATQANKHVVFVRANIAKNFGLLRTNKSLPEFDIG